jgi:hypothetical protein
MYISLVSLEIIRVMTINCKRCGYTFESQYFLLRHLKRKKPCDAVYSSIDINDYLDEVLMSNAGSSHVKCVYCGAEFSHLSSKSRHQKICQSKRESQTEGCDTVQELRRKLCSVTNELLLLQRSSMSNNNLSNNTNNDSSFNTTTNNTNSNNTTNNNITIHLNNFGSETYDHIDNDFIKQCVMNSITGLKQLIEKIHFSDEAPKNKNIRLKSLKRSMVEVANDNNWTIKDAHEALDTMINKGCVLMNGIYANPDSGLQDIDEKELDYAIQIELNKISTKDKNLYNAIRRRILALIASHT